MKKLFLLVLAIVVASCGYEIRKKPEPPKPKLTKEQEYEQRLKDYDVEFLFECNGVKVYRFIDAWYGNYVYFTNANGRTYYEYIRRTKYSSIKHEIQSLNTKK